MSEFIIQIEKLLGAFADPEYRYLLLEPLISYGLLTGVILLIAGFFAKAPRLQVAALVVIGAAAMLHFPYKDARIAAKPRLEQVYKVEAPARASEFARTTNEWIANSWQFKLLILGAFGTLLIGVQRNRIGFGLSLATIALGLLAAKNAMWLNYQDALAYHPNLKRHDAPIDRKTADSVPPPARDARREPSRAPASRTPATPVAQPVAPAARVPAPAPKPATFPSPYPDPRSVAPPAGQPVPAPATSQSSPQMPFGKKARHVEPLPRF
jgi:hypothetical protein